MWTGLLLLVKTRFSQKCLRVPQDFALKDERRSKIANTFISVDHKKIRWLFSLFGFIVDEC